MSDTPNVIVGVLAKALRELEITAVCRRNVVEAQSWQDLLCDMIPLLDKHFEKYDISINARTTGRREG